MVPRPMRSASQLERQPLRSAFRAGLLLLIVIGDGVLLANAADLRLITILAGHLGLSAALLAVAARLGPGCGVTREGVLLAAATLAMGPIGTVGLPVAQGMHQWRRRIRPAIDWHQILLADDASQAAMLHERVVWGRDQSGVAVSVTPFADILAHGTIEQKQRLMEVVTRRFRPELGAVLRRALVDPDALVRVQAATATAHITDAHHAEQTRLAAAVASDPGDLDRQLALARHCHDGFLSGLQDATQRQTLRETAELAYGRCLELQPVCRSARLGLARLLVETGQPAAALATLEPILEKELTPEALLCCAAALLRLRRLDVLRALACRCAQVGAADDAGTEVWQRVAAVWARLAEPVVAGHV
jgi:hypothetical protein